MQEQQEAKTVLPFEVKKNMGVNPCTIKPDITKVFKKIGIKRNFLDMSHHLFKKADVVSELVPELFPFAVVTEEKRHLFYIDTKHNFENFIVSKRNDEKIVDIYYYFNNGQELKISVIIEELEENGHSYQYHISRELKARLKMNKKELAVMVNQQVQTVAVMLLMLNEGYCLHAVSNSWKVRTGKSFKPVGWVDLVCRVNGTYTAEAYPWFSDVDWVKKKILHEQELEND